jgi:hypothetical protein
MSGIYTPTVVYVVFGLVSMVVDITTSPVALALSGIRLFFLLLTTLLINYLCSLGLSMFVWIYLIFSIGTYIIYKVKGQKLEQELEKQLEQQQQKKKKTVKLNKNK